MHVSLCAHSVASGYGVYLYHVFNLHCVLMVMVPFILSTYTQHTHTRAHTHTQEDVGLQEPMTCLSLFPRHGPLRSSATTNGVLVECAAVVQPELNLEGSDTLLRERAWAYSVEFSAAPANAGGGDDDGGGGLVSAQLQTRHWYFEDESGQPQTVDGAGVIGLYPTVTPTMGTPIIYQSQTRIVEYKDKSIAAKESKCDGKVPNMRGHFGFVEGTRAAPTGPTFDAVCARVNFINEEFVY